MAESAERSASRPGVPPRSPGAHERARCHPYPGRSLRRHLNLLGPRKTRERRLDLTPMGWREQHRDSAVPASTISECSRAARAIPGIGRDRRPRRRPVGRRPVARLGAGRALCAARPLGRTPAEARERRDAPARQGEAEIRASAAVAHARDNVRASRVSPASLCRRPLSRLKRPSQLRVRPTHAPVLKGPTRPRW